MASKARPASSGGRRWPRGSAGPVTCEKFTPPRSEHATVFDHAGQPATASGAGPAVADKRLAVNGFQRGDNLALQVL